MINKRAINFTYERKAVDLKPMAIFLSEKFEKEFLRHAENEKNY